MNIKEQMYIDFKEKLIPLLGEGFNITKDYIQDIGGRYIQYLTISDSFMIFVYIVLFILSLIILNKGFDKLKNVDNILDDTDSAGTVIIYLLPGFILLSISIVNTIKYSDLLIKDIYVPEVRIYEGLNNNK